MALPEFRHIHCSSRFDRSAASLESDLDDWMSKSSLITVTEVTNDNRASKLREKGWSYFNSKLNHDADNCAIAWKKEDWHLTLSKTMRLSSGPYHRPSGTKVWVWAATVILRRPDTGHRLMVSVSHFPAHVGAELRTDGDQMLARKQAYLTALRSWSKYVNNMERKHTVDANLFVADWNVNLKDTWARQMIMDHWGKGYHMAWQHFPTEGGSLGGQAHHSIIDGSLYQGLKVTDEPYLMPIVRSSDHRPFRESFRFLGKAENPPVDDTPSGDVHYGKVWWGFGDYGDDEIYQVDRQTEDA